MPGSVESIAVSSVQSIKAPLDNRNRRVGSTEAATAGVTVGRSSAFMDWAESPDSSPGRVREEPTAPRRQLPERRLPRGPIVPGTACGGGTREPCSKASSPGDFTAVPSAAPAAVTRLGIPQGVATVAGKAGAGPKTRSIALASVAGAVAPCLCARTGTVWDLRAEVPSRPAPGSSRRPGRRGGPARAASTPSRSTSSVAQDPAPTSARSPERSTGGTGWSAPD